MYAKLVFRNAKRSAKDYLVYIVTMTICVMLFYAFLSITSKYYNPDVGTEYEFTLVSDGLKFRLIFLPPYSPELNPIEHFWAWLKRYLHSALSSSPSFDLALFDAFQVC